MSIPGWYPDPARQPGQFRYWDGTAWSTGTSGNPADPPPSQPGAPKRRRRTGPIIAATALLLVFAVAAFLFLRPGPEPVTTVPTPSATVSAEATNLPTPTPTATEPAPTASPSSADPNQACTAGDPETRQPHLNDGLVHGGGLAFPPVAGWSSESLPRRLSWAFDLGAQQAPSSLSSQRAMIAVGALSTVEGFEVPEQAADLVLDCMTGPTFYPAFVDRRDIATVAVDVDGYDGWRIRTVMTYGSGTTAIDLVDVIVVDLGSPESLAMFWGTAPAADQGLVRLLDRTVTRLQTD